MGRTGWFVLAGVMASCTAPQATSAVPIAARVEPEAQVVAPVEAAAPADPVAPAAGAPPAPAPAPEPAPAPPPRPLEEGVSGLLQAIPRLRRASADETEAAWQRVKALEDPSAQAKEVAKTRLERTICKDLADFRALPGDLPATFSYRDDLRGRSWLRPAVARVLVRAMGRLHEAYPAARISMGDASQPGCGPLTHGTLVRHLDGDGAVAILNAARLVGGSAVAVEARRATDFPQEADRFWAPENRVRVEHRVIGQWGKYGTGEWGLRVATRRYVSQGAGAPEDWTRAQGRLAGLLRSGKLVSAERTRSWDPELGLVDAWVQRWVQAATGRQAVVVSTRKLAKRLLPEALREVRLAHWQPEKPESMRGEELWRAEPAEGGGVAWERWQLMHEAGHQTHLAGRDVDLSFVTVDNANHFAVDLAAMEVAATWRWFELLVETGEALGTPVDRILVDRKVKKHLEAHLTKEQRRSKAWRYLIVVAGHDAHHHLRIAVDSPERDRQARADLGGR